MKNLRCYLVVFFLSFFVYKGNTQLKIGSNPTTIGTSSLLELESTTKGMVLPRMTTTQVNAIVVPVKGMQVFNVDSNCISTYTGAAWQLHCSTGGPSSSIEPWYNTATGNGATSNTQNIYQTGNVSIGTSSTIFKLNVLGGSQFGQTLAGAGIRLQTVGSYGDISGINHANNAFNDLSFTTGGSPTMYITAAGNVGIGTIPGAGKLDVRTATAAQNGIYSQATTGNGILASSTTGTAINGQSSAGGTGVYGQTTTGLAVYGAATSTGNGVYGSATSGDGVFGIATTTGVGVAGVATSGNGVYGQTSASQGVYGIATGTGNGVYGQAVSGEGLYGISVSGYGGYVQSTSSVGLYSASTSGIAVLGSTAVSGNYSGQFNNSNAGGYGGIFYNTANGHYLQGGTPTYGGVSSGDFAVVGTLSKTAGTFKIDHPLDPANKYLIHSFVESPDMMNVYNGNITTDGNGQAIVTLPNYFYALNKDFRYQLTVIGSFAQTMVATKISANNTFTIKSDKPNIEVSWQVTGVRQDAYANAHRIVAVVDKTGNEKGKYIYPELFGQSKEKGIFYTPVTKEVIKNKTNKQ